MSEIVNKKDLRVQKTHKVLMDAFHRLLRQKSFNQITINELCQSANVSRATFYAHFEDKYDLLKYWLDSLEVEIISRISAREDIEPYINALVYENKKLSPTS